MTRRPELSTAPPSSIGASHRGRRVRATAVAATLAALLVGGCSDDGGGDATSTTDAAAIPAVADLPAPEGDGFCQAVAALVAAKDDVRTLREDAEVAGTEAEVLTSQAFRDAMGAVATASGQYLTTAPTEVVTLAQEKERFDDEVGAQLLAEGELDDSGEVSLDRAGALATRLGEYSETHCGEVAVPS